MYVIMLYMYMQLRNCIIYMYIIMLRYFVLPRMTETDDSLRVHLGPHVSYP